MTLIAIPPTTITHLGRTRSNKTLRARLEDYDDLPNSVIYLPSTGKWVWEATVAPTLLVTVRKVDRTRVDSLDADIVDGDAIYNEMSPSRKPKDLAATIRKIIRAKTRGVSLAR